MMIDKYHISKRLNGLKITVSLLCSLHLNQERTLKAWRDVQVLSSLKLRQRPERMSNR